MSFELCENGVSDQVKSFINALDLGSEVIWVTFTVAPNEEMLEVFWRSRHDVTVVGRHPSEADPRRGDCIF